MAAQLPVLVLGGRERHALAIVRSLGRRGIRVYAADDHRHSTAALSRHCAGQFTYPSPERAPAAFVAALADILREKKFEMVFAVTDILPIILSRNKGRLSKYTQLLVPDPEVFERANVKSTTFAMARHANIPIPETHVIRNLVDLEAIRGMLQYPIVLKPCTKTTLTPRGALTIKARYARSAAELTEQYTPFAETGFEWLVQEYIPGDSGCGVGVLCENGRTLASFAFKRLHEYPVSGGASTLRVGIEHPEMVGAAQRLMKALEWNGVAMVEFKIDDRDGRPKLIEVNGRFWGSLALAIHSGVDFPYLLYRLCKDGDIGTTPPGIAGIKARWLVPGDIMYFLDALRSKGNRLATIADFFQCRGIKDDVIALDDPMPVLGELRMGLKYFTEVLRRQRRLHGDVRYEAKHAGGR